MKLLTTTTLLITITTCLLAHNSIVTATTPKAPTDDESCTASDESCDPSAAATSTSTITLSLTELERFPASSVQLSRASFHDYLNESVMIVGFHGDESTPGWLDSAKSLNILASRIHQEFAGSYNSSTNTTISRVIVGTLSEKNAPRLYRQYAQTTHNKDTIFTYMFLPQSPDLPLKVSWDKEASSLHAIIIELKKLNYQVVELDEMKEELEKLVVAKESLEPLITQTQALLETMESPDSTVRGMKYLRILRGIQMHGLTWLAKQMDSHSIGLSGGRCGSKVNCVKGWQNKQLLKHFAGRLLDDSRAELESVRGGRVTTLHAKYGLPSPNEMMNYTTSSLLLLSQKLEGEEDDLEAAYLEKGEDIVDQMKEMGNIAPAVTNQRLRETYLLAEREEVERISGKFYIEYGTLVHQCLFTKKLQARIQQLYERAELRERGERARDKMATTSKKSTKGPLM